MTVIVLCTIGWLLSFDLSAVQRLLLELLLHAGSKQNGSNMAMIIKRRLKMHFMDAS